MRVEQTIAADEVTLRHARADLMRAL